MMGSAGDRLQRAERALGSRIRADAGTRAAAVNDVAEEDLVDRAVAGDRRAIEALLCRYYPLLQAFARKICRGRSEAEDIAQDAVVKIMGSIRTFDRRCALGSWMYRVVLTKAQDHYRKSGRRSELHAEVRGLAVSVETPRQEDAATARQLWDLLLALPEAERTVAVLVLGEGLTHRETAEILGCPVGTIGWRMGRAMKRLRAVLEDQDAKSSDRHARSERAAGRATVATR